MLNSKNALRIGYIVKMYPRLSETFIVNEILELERRGVEIVIFSLKKPTEGKFHPQLSKVKAKVFYLESLDPKKWGVWIGDNWQYVSSHKQQLWSQIENALTVKDNQRIERLFQAAWLGAKAKELELSHLHAHFASIPSTTAYFAHLITGIPFSFTAHAKDIFVYNMEYHHLREKLHAAKFIVTVTNYNYRFLTEKAPEINGDKIKVIYNGVNIELLKPDDNNSRKSDLIIGVGRLVPKKGFAILLDACKMLKDRQVKFRCVIAGDGSEADNLFQKTRELGLTDEVTFLGPQRQDEVLDLMHQATVLCQPCTVADDGNQDALPTVLLEAMACGIPSISTNISGIPEIIDSDIDGILVEPDNPAILSEQLERLLKSQKLQQKLADGGLRKSAEKFDIKKNVTKLLNLYSGEHY